MIETEFLSYVVKQIVDDADAVKITRTEDERGELLTLEVAPDDLGRVIGRHGATAQSLRSLLRALGTKNNAHYNLKIVDTDAAATNGVENTTSKIEKTDDDSAKVENSNSENVSETVEKSDDTSDRAKKLREDLADLDDLDI